MDGDEEEDTGYEMLTGVELYHHLTSTNHAKQTEIEQKISSYGALSQTLTDLLAKPKHAILAPLCGGLAYVEAELVHTNDVLVLLGDSWFAERSVKQAQAITDRRVAFLKNESAVLRHEAAQLEAKKEMFFEEFPEAREEMIALGGGDLPPPQQQPASSSSSKEEQQRVAGEQEGDFLFALEDELDGEELEALEREIGEERLGDDAFVEACLEKKMMEKRAKRLAKARAEQQEQSRSSLPPSSKSAKAINDGAHAEASLPHRFVNPSQINYFPPSEESATAAAAALPSSLEPSQQQQPLVESSTGENWRYNTTATTISSSSSGHQPTDLLPSAMKKEGPPPVSANAALVLQPSKSVRFRSDVVEEPTSAVRGVEEHHGVTERRRTTSSSATEALPDVVERSAHPQQQQSPATNVAKKKSIFAASLH